MSPSDGQQLGLLEAALVEDHYGQSCSFRPASLKQHQLKNVRWRAQCPDFGGEHHHEGTMASLCH